tara:strand:- start:16708 stop:17547 length:840 start_codon:yes stop_codon:yes gene_type:complete
MREAKQFFEFVNEREHIRILKDAGALREHWTKDPILREFRFCNVFREDDRTTRYFASEVREPLRYHTGALIATIGWRWFNRIETCEKVAFTEWAYARTDWMREAFQDVHPLVTGAYIVKTPNGMSKLEGILKCIDVANDHWALKLVKESGKMSLEEMHHELMEIPYLGRFMAYEIVTDLRHTYLGENAPDIMTWANAGPGAIRGLGWVLESNPGLMSYGPKKSQEAACELMRCLLARSQSDWNWPDRPWEMREVEHCLCEFDKYRRAQGGQRLKRRYQS